MTGFAAELRGGGPPRAGRRGLWLTFLSPFGLELAGGCGAEWIGIDVQHGDLELGDVAPLARVSPVPVLVRLASHDEAQLARVLDAGVDGLIVPAVESAGQARHLVQAAYVPPRGRRSQGLARAALIGPRDQPLLLPMIETRAGLDHLDDILGVDGVDGVFLGPYDLSLHRQPGARRAAPGGRPARRRHRRRRPAGRAEGDVRLTDQPAGAWFPHQRARAARICGARSPVPWAFWAQAM